MQIPVPVSTPWTRPVSSVELLLAVDRDGPHTLGAQIEEQLRSAIRSGALRPGAQVPSTRDLARQLEHLAARRRRGLRPARGRGLPEPAPGRAAARVRRPPSPQPPAPDAAAAAPVAPRFDFRPSVPDVSAFPRAAWLRSLREALSDAHRRRARLRRPVRRRAAAHRAGRLPRPRARRRRRPGPRRRHQRLRAGPGLVCRALASARRDSGSRSRTRATPEQYEIATRAGLEPVPVAVDEHGLRVDELGARRRRDRHARPSAPDRRRAQPPSAARRCCAWLRDHDAIAIEDDYDAEYRYDRAAVGALQGLEPERVVYAGSACKTLAPALRLGWLVVPRAPRRADPPREVPRRPGHGADRAAAFARLPRARRARPPPAPHALPLPRAPRRARRGDRGRAAGGDGARDRRRACTSRSSCPPGYDERAIKAAARRAADRLRTHAPTTARRGAPTLMLGYGQLPEPAIRAGVRELAELVRQHRARPRRVVDVSPDERFEALYREHYAAVLRFARRRTDPQTAEDVTAETFAIAWRRLDEGPGPPSHCRGSTSPPANELANRRRKAASDRAQGRARPARDRPRPRRGARRARRRPAAPSPALSERDREALRLVAWEGLSLADGARVAGTTRVAFAVRVSRARKRLAAALEEEPAPRPPRMWPSAPPRRAHPRPRRSTPPRHAPLHRHAPLRPAPAPAAGARLTSPIAGADHVR